MPPRKWTEFPVAGGFRSWNRHGDLVVLYGDNEIGGFDLSGLTLWGAYLTEDWVNEVNGKRISLTEPNGPLRPPEDYRRRVFDFSQGPLSADWVNCTIQAIPIKSCAVNDRHGIDVRPGVR